MTGRVLNLCFHGIGVPGRQLEPGEYRYWITADEYHRILDEVAGWPAVRLSFDDGNASDVEIGLPGLLERGLSATFFPVAARLDTGGSLEEADVRSLVEAGMRIGTHGMWHQPWRGLSPAERDAELVEARERLAKVAGAPVDEAALPLGRYDRRLLRDLRRLGYTRVYTSDRRQARDRAWLQPRFSVMSGDTPESLRQAVLRAPSLAHRAKLAAVGTVKRLR